jgi:hypothetical protein
MILKNTGLIFTALYLIVFTRIIFAGGPPWLTDDPMPLELGHHELYLFSTGVINNGGVNGIGPAIEFNYGFLPNFMSHLILPLSFDAPKNGKNHFGYGDTEVGIKYRFVEQTDDIPAIGTFPIAEIPTGNSSDNLGNGKTQLYLPVWLQKDIGNWTICSGGGYWINPGKDNKNWQFYGLQVQYNFSDDFYLGMETFHQTASTVDLKGYTGIHIGGAVTIVKSYQLLFSGDAGDGITSYKHFSYYLGLYHEF